MGKVRFVVEQSKITELLLDCCAACRVRSYKVTVRWLFLRCIPDCHKRTSCITGYTGREVPIIDVYGERITVTTRFGLIPVKRPIMSACRFIGKKLLKS